MLILDMLKNPSERDKQSLIGASEIGNPCDYCVGCRLLGRKQKESLYWLGGRIGTGIHAELEKEAEKHTVKAENYRFLPLEGARIEQKITLGTIDGLGTLKSKPDLVLVRDKHLLDHKTTSKTKLAKYKLDGVPMQYVYQQSLYAWGLGKEGIEIERISLVFICRDGSGDNDIWIYSWDYDEAQALKAWDRLELIWKWLQDGNDVETLTSDPGCWYCNNVLQRW